MIYRDATWSKIKSLADGGLLLSYIAKPCRYVLYIEDGEFLWEHQIYRNMWPAACYMTEQENASNRIDFETNYKPAAREL